MKLHDLCIVVVTLILLPEMVTADIGNPTHLTNASRNISSLSNKHLNKVRFTDKYSHNNQWFRLQPDYEYVIIVPDRLLGKVIPLAAWKQKKGLKTLIAPLSIIKEEPTFENIHAFLKHIYDLSGKSIKYILLAGDARDIPPHYRLRDWQDAEPVDDKWVVSDMFYGIMGSGPFPEIHVGRFPASTAGLMKTMVKKTIHYEKYPSTDRSDWFNSALLFGQFSEMDGYAMPDAWCESYFDPPVPSDYSLLDNMGWSVEYLIDADGGDIAHSLNQGKSLACIYGHGTPNWAGGLGINNYNMTLLLDNGNQLPLMISGACNSVRFDNEINPYMQTDGYVYSDKRCFGEKLLEAPDKGVIGIIGSSRAGDPGYKYYFFDGCFEELINGSGRMGPVIDAGRRRSYTESKAGEQGHGNNAVTRQYNIEHMNLLGDPELPIYTGFPHELNIKDAQNESSSAIWYEPVVGVTVCLRRKANDFLVGSTDDFGRVTFKVPVSWSTFYLTATKNNHIPTSTRHHITDFVTIRSEGTNDYHIITLKVEDLGQPNQSEAKRQPSQSEAKVKSMENLL